MKNCYLKKLYTLRCKSLGVAISKEDLSLNMLVDGVK